MVRKLSVYIIIFFQAAFVFSQNIGQKGDSLINYIDINGNKQGFWQKKYDNGKVKYEGYFRNDYPVGTFKRFYNTGIMFSVLKYDAKDYKAQKSRAKIYYESGKIMAMGNFIEHKKDSTWLYFNEDSVVVYREEYKKGKREGISCKYYTNGNKCEEITYKDDKADGPWTQYFENGAKKLFSGNIKNKRNGAFYVYYPSGQIDIMGFYKDGLKDGKWNFYNEDGTIRKEMQFVKDHALNEDEIDSELGKQILQYEKDKEKYIEPEKEFMDKMMKGDF